MTTKIEGVSPIINCVTCQNQRICKYQDIANDLCNTIKKEMSKEMDENMLRPIFQIRCSYYKGKPLPQYE